MLFTLSIYHDGLLLDEHYMDGIDMLMEMCDSLWSHFEGLKIVVKADGLDIGEFERFRELKKALTDHNIYG